MIPLLLKAPGGRPARIVGLGPKILHALQHLRSSGWPIVIHDPEGARTLTALSGIRMATNPPAFGEIRQASLVLLGSGAPGEWKKQVREAVEGSGVPFLDEDEPAASGLAFPSWIPGRGISMALWSPPGTAATPHELFESFAHGLDTLFPAFLNLVEKVKAMVTDSIEEDEFREKVLTQLAAPEILALLMRGEHDRALTSALKVIGSSTRSVKP